MKIRFTILLLLALSATLEMQASQSVSGTSSGATAYATAPAGDHELSDRRWIIISGKPYFLTATGGSFYVTSSYYNSGDLTSIPLSEFRYDPNQGYAFESVSSVGDDTGTHISGGSSTFNFSTTYSGYHDDQTNRTYAAHGCFALLPAINSSLHEQWDRWTTVGLKSCNGYWLCAENGGGSPLYANRSDMGPWETFRVCGNGASAVDRVSGQLNSGDTISMLSATPYWVCAENGTQVYVVANRSSAGLWEHFTISKTSGYGAINNGDSVSILAPDSNKYWCAELGGEPYIGPSASSVIVNANRADVGGWETFQIAIQ